MSIQIGTVNINVNPTHESRFDYRKQSQLTNEFEDGTFETFASGRTMIDVSLNLDFVSNEDWDDLISWLNDTVLYSRFTFTVTPPVSLDIGLGLGVAVTNATYTGPANTKDLYTPVGRLGRKNVIFPFSYPKPIVTSLVDENGVVVI
jgi:hypothetical protein